MEFLGIHIHKMNITVKPLSPTTLLVYDHLHHLTISSCISVETLSTQEVKRAQKRVQELLEAQPRATLAS